MPMNWKCRILTCASLLFLSACGTTPVAVTCPPFPQPPRVVEQELFVTPARPLIQDYSEALDAFLSELRGLLQQEIKPAPTSLPVRNGL